MPKPTKPTADIPPEKTLAERVRELPDGTKESAAFAALGQGVTREAFREIWLSERVSRGSVAGR